MLENKLKELIIEKFGSIRQFSFKIDIPYTTVDSILKRGLDNSNVGNVIKMCKALDISIDNLLDEKEIISNTELEINHNKYKQILKKKGLMDENDNINEENLDKLLKIADMVEGLSQKKED